MDPGKIRTLDWLIPDPVAVFCFILLPSLSHGALSLARSRIRFKAHPASLVELFLISCIWSLWNWFLCETKVRNYETARLAPYFSYGNEN
jgi:hypothetical protein